MKLIIQNDELKPTNTITINDIVKITTIEEETYIGRVMSFDNKHIILDMSTKYNSNIKIIHIDEINNVER